jgi:glyoxylase-like metal-dependent hydrolase (beta-lactamase superfamily II)
MTPAHDLESTGPGLFIWHAYDPTVKTDLFSTVIVTRSGLVLVDPIPLDDQSLTDLRRFGAVFGIVVTNENHPRAAADYSEMFDAPIFTRAAISASCPINAVDDGHSIANELRVITIDGAPPGEIALYHSGSGGMLIVGDALINFEPYGLAPLPKKYCQNEKRMRRSLLRLLDFPAERLLFAHGTPIVAGAGSRLRELLGGEH